VEEMFKHSGFTAFLEKPFTDRDLYCALSQAFPQDKKSKKDK